MIFSVSLLQRLIFPHQLLYHFALRRPDSATIITIVLLCISQLMLEAANLFLIVVPFSGEPGDSLLEFFDVFCLIINDLFLTIYRLLCLLLNPCPHAFNVAFNLLWLLITFPLVVVLFFCKGFYYTIFFPKNLLQLVCFIIHSVHFYAKTTSGTCSSRVKFVIVCSCVRSKRLKWPMLVQ